MEYVGIYPTTLISQNYKTIQFRVYDSVDVNYPYLYLPVYNISVVGDFNQNTGVFYVEVSDIKRVYSFPSMRCSIITIMNNGDKHTYGHIDMLVQPE